MKGVYGAHGAGSEMERREQERVADVHSKHSIYLSFLLMEGLVKMRGLREGTRTLAVVALQG